MKPKIRFGVFDIILCFLLAAAVGVNVYAFAGDAIGDALSRGKSDKYDYELNGNAVPMAASDVNAGLLNGTWTVNLFLCEDDEFDSYYLWCEMRAAVTESVTDVYSLEFTTTAAEYGDGSSEGIAAISGGVTATVTGGVMAFQLPGVQDTVFHLDFWTVDGEAAGVAYEVDLINKLYYAMEMYK